MDNGDGALCGVGDGSRTQLRADAWAFEESLVFNMQREETEMKTVSKDFVEFAKGVADLVWSATNGISNLVWGPMLVLLVRQVFLAPMSFGWRIVGAFLVYILIKQLLRESFRESLPPH